MHNASPLRYPGGKARLSNYFRQIFYENNLAGGRYVEPYAGGASIALSLLFDGAAEVIHINDLDPSIYAFWHSITTRPSEFCDRVMAVPLTIDEWHRQRDIYRSGEDDLMLRGFATFFLNRTNRSGIIAGAGVIGGQSQAGKWKMDARFPKDTIIARIQRVAAAAERITVTNLDALELLRSLPDDPRTLVYLDPPYFEKADGLYANWYKPDDHRAVRDVVAELRTPWVVSYDCHEEIKTLYGQFDGQQYPLRYSARDSYDGQELMYFSPGLKRPNVQTPVSVGQRPRRKPIEQQPSLV